MRERAPIARRPSVKPTTSETVLAVYCVFVGGAMVGADMVGDVVGDAIMPVVEVLESSEDMFSSRRTLYDHRKPEKGMKSECHFHRLIAPMTDRKKSRGTATRSGFSLVKVILCLPGPRSVFDQSIC
jgi:hypothetical protein